MVAWALSIELEPDNSFSHMTLSEAYFGKGMYEESLEAMKKGMTSWTGSTEVAEAMDQGYAKSD